jgi:antagonist of KipI
MSITIVKAGILDTIQDQGRYGYQQYGINPGGAMDKYAMQVANALAGNELKEAVIEIHFPASVFLFNEPCIIALAGAELGASINGEYIPVLQPIAVGKNDVLQFERPAKGARSYLAVRGGFMLGKWLNSNSTNLKAGTGGVRGRALQKNDELKLKVIYKSRLTAHSVLPWKADIDFDEGAEKAIRILTGNEWSWLTEEAKEIFQGQEFIIDNNSDRMGYRLSGHTLSAKRTEELVSSAVGFGTIQLLPGGMPILLMADHQTTGGYPRIGHVISADHTRLAQMKAGDALFFKIAEQEEAESLYIKQQQHLLQLQTACKLRLEQII